MTRSSRIHTILWRRHDLPGHEFSRLEVLDGGPFLSGTAVFAYDGTPCMLAYQIRCGPDWRTRSAEVEGRIGSRDVAFHVLVSEDRRWTLNGTEAPAVAGCTDIDLGFSPSTNLLPIRRLSLEVDASAAVRAAWLPFPDLSFEPLPQTYHRTGERTYHYESGGGVFMRTLEVDERGFVTRYPGLWEIEPGA